MVFVYIKLKITSEGQMGIDKEFIGSSQIAKKAEKSQEKVAELPKEYGDTKIVALIKDPLWIHAYWEVSPSKKEDLQNILGDSFHNLGYTLRIYDVTRIDFNGDNSNSYFDISVGHDARSWYVNVGNPGSDYIIDLGIMTPEGQFILIARSNKVTTPRNSVSNNIDEQWMMVEEQFAKILELSGHGSFGKASADIMGEITKRLFSEHNLSSSTISSMSSDTIQARKPNKEQDDFWFKVGAELIIYGETLPDAQVKINGNIIKLRNDGSFSLRIDLPDGNYPFPIEAESKNKKHKRNVSIDVNKSTH